MAVVHGKTLNHKINSVSADTYTKQVTVAVDIDTAEKTAAGASAKSYLEGHYGWNMDGDYNWEGSSGQVDATVFAMITSGALNMQLLPGGGTHSSTNNPMYRGTAILKSYQITAPHDGVVVCRASYQGSDALNRYTSGFY
jgi:hypothetical protein